MGKNNRQRRADKRRHRSSGRGGDRGTAFLDARDLAEILVFEAAEAAEHGESDLLDVLIGRLAALGGLAGMAMSSLLVAELRAAWEGGWQPADVVGSAAKRLGAVASELAAEMIAVDARSRSGPAVEMPPLWATQLRALQTTPRPEPQRWSEPGALRLGAGLLGMLAHLPDLPHLCPPPSEWGRRRAPLSEPRQREISGVDGRMLDKVRALLAKAESTEFDEEADALTAKAQELMARHAIDQAMVVGEASGEVPGGRRIAVADPYAQCKANLLVTIAAANRCRAVWMEGYGFSTVVGFANDVDIVEVLFTSLLVQATRAMTASGAVRDSAGRSRTRSFRQSFLISFARRIGERLEAATEVAQSQAGEMHGSSKLLPVLARRIAAVDDAFDAMFPDLVSCSTRISNLAGWVAGRTAADLAHLGPQNQLLPGVAV